MGSLASSSQYAVAYPLNLDDAVVGVCETRLYRKGAIESDEEIQT